MKLLLVVPPTAVPTARRPWLINILPRPTRAERRRQRERERVSVSRRDGPGEGGLPCFLAPPSARTHVRTHTSVSLMPAQGRFSSTYSRNPAQIMDMRHGAQHRHRRDDIKIMFHKSSTFSPTTDANAAHWHPHPPKRKPQLSTSASPA